MGYSVDFSSSYDTVYIIFKQWEDKIGCCYEMASIMVLWQYDLASTSADEDFVKQVSVYILRTVNPRLLKTVQRLWISFLEKQVTIHMHLCYLPQFINVSFLLLELCEGCLDFGNGLIIVGCTVWKAFGEVEAWNVYGGGWGSGHYFGWRRAGRPWGWRGGCRC